VRILLGAFLLVTAGLKVHGLATDPLAADSAVGSPRLLIATIEVEIVLGLWLLSGWSASASWASALVFFGILAGTSLYLALVGQRSCGCFGRVTLNPWWTFALDVAAVGVLALCRPCGGGGGPSTAWQRRLLTVGGRTAALLAGIGTLLLLAGDPTETLARLRGDSIVVDPVVNEVGEGKFGAERTFRVQLANRTDRAIRLVGGTASCSCIATNDLPLTLAARKTASIEVVLKFGGSPGRFQRSYVLFTDDDKQPVVVARFSGRVFGGP
jgi:hypothetical protein